MLTQTSMPPPTRHPAVSRISPHATGPRVHGRGLIDQMDLMGAPIAFSRNAEIFGENEPANYVYKVLSGAVRTYKIFDDGRRQIGAFYFPGDVFGLEVGAEHQFSAEAIDKCVILVVKRSALLTLAEHDGDIARRLWSFNAKELSRVQKHMLLLTKSAEERVACFLLEMAGRLAAAEALELPMSRQDIADYLGLTIETVSRTLTHLEAVSMIALPTARRVVLCNRKALDRLDS